MFDAQELDALREALQRLREGFSALPEVDTATDPVALRQVLAAVAERLVDNFPYFHPLYAGQMLKPPHPIARLAYALSLWINPNNHALDGGRASSAMEKEAVQRLAEMFGWKVHLGHLCGGGTMANLEALWVARERAPGKAVLASEQAHYTHARLASLLGIPHRTVATDARGRLDPADLAEELGKGDVGCVVATLGTTATGAVDPLPDILTLARTHGVRVHVDAAYGGFFAIADDLGESARRAFDVVGEADSLVVDPHKHGLQPYGCGCVLFRDPSVGAVYRHDSPYTYFTSSDLHLGEISLECSRPGAAAVALWATQQLLPYERGGVLARDLGASLRAARALHERLGDHPDFVPLFEPELDIVVFAVRAPDRKTSSAAARRTFERAAASGLHLALATLPPPLLGAPGIPPGGAKEGLLCLRSCLMKPEHEAWLDEILRRLERAAAS